MAERHFTYRDYDRAEDEAPGLGSQVCDHGVSMLKDCAACTNRRWDDDDNEIPPSDDRRKRVREDPMDYGNEEGAEEGPGFEKALWDKAGPNPDYRGRAVHPINSSRRPR